MSLEAITFTMKITDLNSTDKLLLLMISNYANADYVAWASENHLASLCNCSTRTIRRSLRVLQDRQLLEVKPRYDEGRQIRNDFKVLVDRTPVSTTPQTPVSTLNTKIKKQYTEEFGQFWSIYPRHVNKYYANNTWKKVVKDYPPEKIIKATEIFKKKMNTTEEKFIPHASTYLNKKMFLDIETVVEVRKSVIAG
tara:strand:+ start:203 stop:787 length:585 start_codon:yes stop_codon:yes gene_type:complete